MSRHFNPRSREGSDVKITKIEHNGKISIHAPAKGATKRNIAVEPVELHFNPRSREGSDYRLENWKQNFNPRSREGSDKKPFKSSWVQRHFNPRSREGSD